MQKIYVVIYDNQVFHFERWSECSDFIKGKKNVRFRSFTDENEIKSFVDSNIKKEVAYDIEDVLYAYASGGFADSFKEKGTYSVVLIKNGKILFKTSRTIRLKNGKDYPELYAVKKAIDLAIGLKEPRVIIVYSFLGVEMWANGSWRPKCEAVSSYLTYLQKVKQNIVIDFLKSEPDNQFMKVHSYNNLAKGGTENL